MQKANKFTYTIAAIFAAVVLIISFVWGGGAAVAHAATSTAKAAYERQNVINDLQDSTIDGEPFSLDTFGFDENKDLRVISFVEYCYSFYSSKQGDFDLYVYVYNPQGINIAVDSELNKIQMDYAGSDNWFKYDLQFLNRCVLTGYEGLFIKYKVKLPDGQRAAILKALNSSKRVYEVSGIELLTAGQYTAVEYPVESRYEYSGYSKGYGSDSNAESTLQCKLVEGLETVRFDVNHTFYRTKTSSKGAPWSGAKYQMQLDTVYFAIPQRFLDDYGKLQRIKAEWYEYYTKEIVVTSNNDFYNKALPYMGYRLSMGSYLGKALPEYNSNIYYSLGANAYIDPPASEEWADWSWNLGTGYYSNRYANPLYYLFLCNSISDYDPYADVTKNGGVTSNELYDYIKAYNKTYENGTVKGGLISADLFEDDIPDERKIDNSQGKIQKGYSYYDFDVDTDLQEIKGYNPKDNSFFDNQKMYGFWNALFGNYGDVEEDLSLSPILVLTDDDVKGTTTADRQRIADTLCINYNDVADLQEFYREATTIRGEGDELKAVVLFRFATSNYFTSNVDIIELGKGFLGSDKHTSGQAYFAQQSVFFDFDIIQLTFKKGNVFTVIPVVASPIDIVNDVTPPPIVDGSGCGVGSIFGIIFAIVLVLFILWTIKLLRGAFGSNKTKVEINMNDFDKRKKE